MLAGISVSHLLNDTVQSLIPAIYPMLKAAFALSFAQVGLMTLTLQLTASLLQPLVGFYTDRRPTPYSLVIGMGVTKMAPGSQKGLQVVVDDVEAVKKVLTDRGLETSEVDVQPWGSFIYFSDPDGNTWSVQQIPIRR